MHDTAGADDERRQRQPNKLKRKRPLSIRTTIVINVAVVLLLTISYDCSRRGWFLVQALLFPSSSFSSPSSMDLSNVLRYRRTKRARILQTPLWLNQGSGSNILSFRPKQTDKPKQQQQESIHSLIVRLFSVKKQNNNRRDEHDNDKKFNATLRHSQNEGNFSFLHALDDTQWMTLPSKDDSRIIESRTTSSPSTSKDTVGNITTAGDTNKIAAKLRSTRPVGHSFVSFPESRLREYYAWLLQQQHQQQHPEQPQPSSALSSRLEILSDKSPNDFITVADLEHILRQPSALASQSNPTENHYSTSIKDEPPFRGSVRTPVPARIRAAATEKTTHSSSVGARKTETKKQKNVAFPQPSVLSYESVKWGTTTSGSILGMIVGISMAPNLWLMGALLGGLYGYETGQRLPQEQTDDDSSSSSNLMAAVLIRCGRQLAGAYLKMYDSIQTVWFMYKTGQLSYEYYKRYAELDNRFAIQQKMDAWNARFVQGKLAFDKWEQDNEVGRKVLAALRTAWLVEERSKNRLRKGRRRSRYRLIQILYDASYTIGQLWASTWQSVTAGQSRFKEFLRGAMTTSGSGSPPSSRVGSMLAALIVVNMVGTLFTVSPVFLGVVVATVGYAWPSWVSELTQRATAFVEAARARGRGDSITTTLASAPTPANATNSINHAMHNVSHVLNGWFNIVSEATAGPRAAIKAASSVDKSRYHYFRTKNGKKRYYRVGVPWWTSSSQPKRKEVFYFPWQKD